MKIKENILISHCLLGEPCRFDGKSKPMPDIESLKEKYNLIPVCPEVMGGLPTPRNASEIQNGKVIDTEGNDVTSKFVEGARQCLEIAKTNNIRIAILKANSPSCGTGLVYDGSFGGNLIKGNGITTQLLLDNGISVFNETSPLPPGIPSKGN